MHPNLKLLISLGGWTYSDGVYSAATTANRSAFVASCIDIYIKGNLPAADGRGGAGAAAGVFDGIDLDWEYPGVCGNNPSCGASGSDKANYAGLLDEFRAQLNAVRPGLLLTTAVAADPNKIATVYDVPAHQRNLDWINLMSYDFFGGWDLTHTAPQSPLYAFKGQSTLAAPTDKFYSAAAIDAWIAGGASASKLQLGVPFYGRGWTGVGNVNGGLMQPGSGCAPGTYECGIEDYKVLVNTCPATGIVPDAAGGTNPGAGTAMAYCGTNWWSYDTPATLAIKMGYVKTKGLAGAFFWEADGDTTAGALITAMRNGLP
jgi:chitinase